MIAHNKIILASAATQPLAVAINTPLVAAVNQPLVVAIDTLYVAAISNPVTLIISNDDGYVDDKSTEEDIYPMGEDSIYNDEVLQELMHDMIYIEVE